MPSRKRRNSKERSLAGRRVLLIVTGGISAYKSAYLVRLLKKSGADVRVVMTEAGSRFVTPLTFETLSENPVYIDMFAPRTEPGIEHVDLAVWADVVVVAPATADFIAKCATGIADDLASTTIVASRCAVYLAPAMNQAMWQSPTVRRNIETLRSDGRFIIEPGSGELACGEEGPGRMAEPEEILEALVAGLPGGELSGLKVVVTAGRTEEDIDDVRFITNRSSGRMGFALARELKRRGAEVHLIHGAVDVEPPAVDRVTSVRSAREMADATKKAFPSCDLLLMTAAVSDFTPARKARGKIKREKSTLKLELKSTEDILKSISRRKKKNQVVVGFALEAGEGEKEALKKLKSKGCDYIVLNLIGPDSGFSVPTNRVIVYNAGGRVAGTPLMSKEEVASAIVEIVIQDERIKRKING